MTQMDGILEFLRAAEGLKTTLRSGHMSNGRQESTAEHSWRLCLWALAFEDELGDLDMLKLLKMLILHDLGEAISGDIPAPQQTDGELKTAQENADWDKLLAPLPTTLQDRFKSLWHDYETGQSPEAVMAKALDKCETILQHNQGDNPADFDYAFNLDYGRAATDRVELTRAIRTQLDDGTKARMS